MDRNTAALRLSKLVDEQDHAQGPATAVVTLVEYGDYECPYTRSAHSVVKELQRLSGDWLRFVFRHFPKTEKHQHAQQAAEAAESAAAQGMFWEMHECLLQRPHLDEQFISECAEEVGLDEDDFMQDFGGHTYLDKVKADMESGISSGVKETPTFYINDKIYAGEIGLQDMLNAIESAADDISED